MFCLALAIVAFVAAMLGCASAKIKNRCPVFFLGLISFVLMIVYILVGATLVLTVSLTDAEFNKMCANTDIDSRTGDALSMIRDIDGFYYDVGQTMCSYACPCPIGFSGAWSQSETGWTEQQINDKFGRTYSALSDNSVANSGLYYLQFTSDTNTKTFTSFYDCLTRDD